MNSPETSVNFAAPTMSWGMQLLQLAKSGNWDKIFKILNTHPGSHTNFADVNPEDGNTLLHYAANREKRKLAADAVEKLLACQEYNEMGGRLVQIEFVDKLNYKKETALQIATTHRNKRLVKLLIKHGADIYKLKRQSDTKAIKMIYDRALIAIFDEAITIEKDEDDPDNVSVWEIGCDFEHITGLHNPTTDEGENVKIRSQTLHLAQILRTNTASRSAILQHPLVQIFLHLKGEKFNPLLYCSMLYHIIWSLISFSFILCNTHIVESTNVPDSSRDTNLTELCAPFSIYDPGTLNFNANFYFYTMIILFTLSVAIEIIEQFTCPEKWYYYKQLENLGQIVVLLTILVVWIVALVTGLERRDGDGTGWLEQNVLLWLNWIPGIYIAGLFASLLLIQGQLTKFRFLGIYNEMFATGFLNVVRFLLAFLPLLFAFMITFHLLLPMKREFLPSWGLGFSKLLAMMTGEIGHGEILYDEDEDEIAFKNILKLLLIVFTVTVVILLQNLLIGVTVSDVAALLVKAKVNNLATTLEDIYLMENVVTSPLFVKVFQWINKKQWLKRSLIVDECDSRVIDGITHKERNKRLDEYPEEIRNEIIQWDNARHLGKLSIISSTSDA